MQELIKLTDRLPLSRSERNELQHLNKPHQGRNFLPLYRILKNHGLHNEATELLTWGVAKFPKYQTARVLLANDLFHRGLVPNAWDLLKEHRRDLAQNTLAQRLMLQCTVLLSLSQTAHSIYEHLKTMRMSDAFSDQVGFRMESEGIHQARDYLLGKLWDRKIPIEIKNLAWDQPKPENSLQQESQDSLQKLLQDGAFEGYHEVELDQLFYFVQPIDNSTDMPADWKTRAEIFEAQGQFSKSLNIYRELLDQHPRNTEFIKRIKDLAHKARTQKLDELILDPMAARRLEQLEHNRTQLHICQKLLGIFEQKDSGRI